MSEETFVVEDSQVKEAVRQILLNLGERGINDATFTVSTDYGRNCQIEADLYCCVTSVRKVDSDE